MSDDSRVRDTMRRMAWERAKGELRSMGQTIYGDREKFEALDKAVEDFIRSVEDDGLHE